jgi:hypothetical protein
MGETRLSSPTSKWSESRRVVVHGQHQLGVSLKLAAGAIILGLLAAETALPPLAVAAGLVVVLTASVYAERRLIGQAEPTTL